MSVERRVASSVHVPPGCDQLVTRRRVRMVAHRVRTSGRTSGVSAGKTSPADGFSSGRTGQTAAVGVPAPRSGGRGGENSPDHDGGPRWWPPCACGRHTEDRPTRPPRRCGASGPATTTGAARDAAAPLPPRWWTGLDSPPACTAPGRSGVLRSSRWDRGATSRLTDRRRRASATSRPCASAR